MKKALN